MTIAAAIAAQFKPRVSADVAAARLAKCDACPSASRSVWCGFELKRCLHVAPGHGEPCKCILSVNGESIVTGWNTKTSTEGEKCPKGEW